MNIKIENLVGRLDLHFVDHTKIDKEALTKAINESFKEAIAGLSQGVSEINSTKGNDRYTQVIPLLKNLIEKAESAISAIENGRPDREISYLTIEDIGRLTEEIGDTIASITILHRMRERDQELIRERFQLDAEIRQVQPQSPHTP